MREIISHRGYVSDIYLLKTEKGYVLKKYFKFKKGNNVSDITISNIFKEEIDGIRLLNSVKVENVLTPEIIEIDEKNLCYTQKYLELIPFNRYLFLHSGFFYPNAKVVDLFYKLGKYLAMFHIKNKRLHGDLNRRNLLFGKDFIFICDPTFVKKRIYDKYTFDLFKVISDIYSYNLFIRPFIRHKNAIIKSFIRGYFSNSDTVFKRGEFKQDMIRYFRETDPLLSKKLVHHLKTFLITKLNLKLAKRLENNKLKWINEL